MKKKNINMTVTFVRDPFRTPEVGRSRKIPRRRAICNLEELVERRLRVRMEQKCTDFVVQVQREPAVR